MLPQTVPSAATPDPLSDASSDAPAALLVQAARAGHEPAWAELVARSSRLLTAVARRQGLSADDAADVVQEAWVRLCSQLPTLRDPERVPAWLATTVRRECIARRRRAWRESPTWDGSTPDVPDDVPAVDDLLEAQQRAERLHAAVRDLPQRERQLVELLLEPDPVTYAEISRRLSMPVGSIGPIRARALRRLRQALDPSQAEDERPIHE